MKALGGDMDLRASAPLTPFVDFVKALDFSGPWLLSGPPLPPGSAPPVWLDGRLWRARAAFVCSAWALISSRVCPCSWYKLCPEVVSLQWGCMGLH